MEDPTIYVAGHRGLVGGAIVRALRAAGRGRIITRTHAELDLTDQAAARAFFLEQQPEIVILAAARVGGILANWEYPYEFVQENLAIEVNVIHEAFRAGTKRFIFLGSSCIYPRLAPQPLKEEYLLTGPLEETNRAYAVAKIAGIELCRSLAREYGAQCLSLMPTNLYGPGDNFDLETSHLLPALIRKFHEAKVAQAGGWTAAGETRDTAYAGGAAPPGAPAPQRGVSLWGTGRPRRELLYVEDLASAIPLLLRSDDWSGVPDGMLNIGTGEDLSIAEVAVVVARVLDYDGPVTWDTSKPDGTPQKLLDISRITALGWSPDTDLETGIRQTYRWFLENWKPAAPAMLADAATMDGASHGAAG